MSSDFSKSNQAACLTYDGMDSKPMYRAWFWMVWIFFFFLACLLLNSHTEENSRDHKEKSSTIDLAPESALDWLIECMLTRQRAPLSTDRQVPLPMALLPTQHIKLAANESAEALLIFTELRPLKLELKVQINTISQSAWFVVACRSFSCPAGGSVN